MAGIIRKSKEAAQASARESNWHAEATRRAIAEVRKVIKGGTIPSTTGIGFLQDHQLGWLVAAAIFGWVCTRSQQARAEGLDFNGVEAFAHTAPGDPWDAGAIEAILPELHEKVKLDWSKPLQAWSKAEMVEFLHPAFSLIRSSIAARDYGLTGSLPTDAHVTAREMNAAAGGPLMTPEELEHPI